MLDFNYWLLFLTAAFVLNIAPGADVIYILTKTLSGGKRIGIASVLGVCTGAMFHVLLASLGVSAIIFSYAPAFTLVKFLGAMYLFYLAYKAFASAPLKMESVEYKSESSWSAFKQGVIIDILNPKVALFFMAFLPQFVREGYGAMPLQLLFLGSLVIVVALFVEILYVFFAHSLREKIVQNKKLSVWINRFVGSLFITLGVRLLTTSK